MSRTEVRQIVRAALRRGWRDVTHASGRAQRNHRILEWTNGVRITLASTPSDHRASANMKADLRRVERRAARE